MRDKAARLIAQQPTTVLTAPTTTTARVEDRCEIGINPGTNVAAMVRAQTGSYESITGPSECAREGRGTCLLEYGEAKSAGAAHQRRARGGGPQDAGRRR